METTAELLKVLGDPIRLQIIKQLYKDKELCACNIQDNFHITQPTLSFHMKKLINAGLVTSRKDGTWVKYQVNHVLFLNLLVDLYKFTDQENMATEGCSCNK